VERENDFYYSFHGSRNFLKFFSSEIHDLWMDTSLAPLAIAVKDLIPNQLLHRVPIPGYFALMYVFLTGNEFPFCAEELLVVQPHGSGLL
jgi:hypothetical protein